MGVSNGVHSIFQQQAGPGKAKMGAAVDRIQLNGTPRDANHLPIAIH
jgi:hypothetical protein